MKKTGLGACPCGRPGVTSPVRYFSCMKDLWEDCNWLFWLCCLISYSHTFYYSPFRLYLESAPLDFLFCSCRIPEDNCNRRSCELVEALREHPKNPNQILIGYSRALIVLWDLQNNKAIHLFLGSQVLFQSTVSSAVQEGLSLTLKTNQVQGELDKAAFLVRMGCLGEITALWWAVICVYFFSATGEPLLAEGWQ